VPNEIEDVNNLFFTCFRVTALWNAACPLPAPRDLTDFLGTIQHPPLHLQHTAALLLLWVIRKSRNRMIFDDIDETLPTPLAAVASHTHLWVVRARRRVDTSPLLDWCSSPSV
jgi:hypothetical protein